MTTPTTERALDLLGAALLRKGRSANTARAYLSDAKAFLEAAGGTPNLIDDPEAFSVAALNYVDVRRPDWSAATTTRKVSSLRALGDAIHKIDPLPGYKLPSRGRTPAHPLPGGVPDVIAMIRATKDPHHRALVALCGLAGLRISEARSLTTRDFTVDHAGARWLRVKGKGDRERTIPLSRICRDYVEPVLNYEQDNELLFKITDRGARKMITALGQKALGMDVASHDLRMTFGTAVHDSTHDLRVTQELLGHASSSTTELYTAVRDDKMRSAVELA